MGRRNRKSNGRSRLKERLRRSIRRRRAALEPLVPRLLLAADWSSAAGNSTASTVTVADVPAASEQSTEQAAEQNPEQAEDVDGDRRVTSGDGLLLVNAINRVLRQPSAAAQGAPFLDVSGDGRLTATDYRRFTEFMNSTPSSAFQAAGDDIFASGGVEPGADNPDYPLDNDTDGDPTDDAPDTPLPPTEDDNDDSSDVPPAADTDPGEPIAEEPGDSTVQPSPGRAPGSPSSNQDPSNYDDDYDRGPTIPPPVGGGGDGCVYGLTGATVDEGETFTLGLVVDPTCIHEYTVDWGDDVVETFRAAEKAKHSYDDDITLNTAADVFPVFVSLQTIDGGAIPLQTSITVNNVTPRAANDHFSTDEDTRITLSGFADNDGDPSFEDTINIVVSELDTSRTKGTVRQNGNILEYDPRGHFDCLALGEQATDSFRYTIHDDDEPDVETTATITITVHGRREFYTLSYGGGPVASEDGEQPATAFFRLSPPARCGAVSVDYRRVDYDGPARIPMASDNDVQEAGGTIVFEEGESYVTTTITPVDDQIIEEDEWFYFNATVQTTPDLQVHPLNSEGYFKIKDDEWRFVEETKSDSRTIPLVTVQAFSTSAGAAVMSGAYTLDSRLAANLGTNFNSQAAVRADARATLTRPGQPLLRNDGFVQLNFFCHSQTGDIWRTGIKHEGLVTNAMLNAKAGMEYRVHDLGEDDARVVIDVDYAFVAGGEVTKSFSPGLHLQIGDQSKAHTGGSIRLDRRLTYSGGAEYAVGDGFVLRCKRGN